MRFTRWVNAEGLQVHSSYSKFRRLIQEHPVLGIAEYGGSDETNEISRNRKKWLRF
jgi:hypothetical protein